MVRISIQRTANRLTTDRRILFFLTELTDRRILFFLTELTDRRILFFLTELTDRQNLFFLTELTDRRIQFFLTELMDRRILFFLTELTDRRAQFRSSAHKRTDDSIGCGGWWMVDGGHVDSDLLGLILTTSYNIIAKENAAGGAHGDNNL
jgi:hypothetical protein